MARNGIIRSIRRFWFLNCTTAKARNAKIEADVQRSFEQMLRDLERQRDAKARDNTHAT